MNHDMVFYGVFICAFGGAIVLGWLMFVLWRNMNDKSKNDGQ
ncbi:MAG: hypothetical protein AB1400_09495 [Pseudomonadota bacterium]